MVDEKDIVYDPHDDPSTRIWSSYISSAEKRNKNLARSWKGDMDAILIFAGLFSASVTAFIIESYKTLIPNSEDRTNALLTQISQQLAFMSNISADLSTTAAPIPTEFVPPASAVVCNVLWFLSLGFSLASALSATLVEQWVRNYLQATETRPTPHERARICAYLYLGLEKFKMAAVVEAIPMLLHISLLLFFAGLVEFLRPVNMTLSYLTLGMLIVCVMLYALATISPVFWWDCPYQTPLSRVWWKVTKILGVFRRYGSAEPPVLVSGGMERAREAEALRISPERDHRDFIAMKWTLKNLRHESEFEGFVKVIPRAVSGFDYSAKLLLHRLLHHRNLGVNLSHRIPRLLMSCTGGALDPIVCQKRATTCLAAIWSLNMMAVHTDSSDSSSPILSRATLRFDELTLRDILVVKTEVPSVTDYVTSAATSVARGIIDMYVEQTVNQKLLLSEFIESRGTKAFVPSEKPLAYFGDPNQVLFRIRRTVDALEKYLEAGEPIATPTAFILLSSTYVEISKLIALVALAPPGMDAVNLALESIKYLQYFLVQLNQVGFSLVMDYAEQLLTSRTLLPYEAFSTFRRIFLKINFGLGVSIASQTRYVTYLDDALESDSEGRPHMLESIINLVLGLARVVEDPTCALKAKTIVERCMRFFPSEAEARKALAMLNRALPSSPTLDLFTSHMYSNVKLNPSSTAGTSVLGLGRSMVAELADDITLRRMYDHEYEKM